ncbi:MAG: outer membrane lipoprotein carrier protein LolA [Candidatus Eisenbacteria bacterium]
MYAVHRWLAAAAIASALVVPPAVAVEKDPEAILATMRAAREGVSELQGEFIHTKRAPLFEETITSRGVLFFRDPDNLRLQYTEPDSNLVLVANGYVWLYYPSLRQAHRYDIDPESTLPGLFLGLQGTLDGLYDDFEVSGAEGEERADGYPTDVIRLRPKEGTDLAGDVEEIVVMIRRDTALPVRTEFREKSGDRTIFDFRGFRKNPDLPGDLFVFRPPPDTEVFELEGEKW